METSSSQKQQRFPPKTDDKYPSYQSRRSSKHPTRFKPARPNGSTDYGQHCGRRGDPSEGTLFASSGQGGKERLEGRVTKGDDIVRYMSKLPGYLKREEKGENIQGNALNFGVLDWTRLEKWKHKTKCPRTTCRDDFPFDGITMRQRFNPEGNVSSKKTTSYQEVEYYHSSACTNRQPSRKDEIPRGFPPSLRKVRHSRASDVGSGSTYEEVKLTCSNSEASREDSLEGIPGKGTKAFSVLNIDSGFGSSSDARVKGSEILLNKRFQKVDSKMKNGGVQDSVPYKKAMHRRIISEAGAPSKSIGGVSFDSAEKPSATKGKTKKVEMVDSAHRRRTSDLGNFVSARCNQEAPKSREESTKSWHDNLTEAKSNKDTSGFGQQNLLSPASGTQSHHSCPISCNRYPNSMSSARLNVELQLDASKTYSEKRENLVRDKNFSGFNDAEERRASNAESMNVSDQEPFEVSSKRGRHPSPNRLFSFSFSRIGRSLSFKEGSSRPQFSWTFDSVKSGPVKPDDSDSLDGLNSVAKSYGHGRVRSSPFRRILDPILRSKVVRPIYATNTYSLSHGKTRSVNSKSPSSDKSVPKESNETSTVQALVQLTVRNGFPLFQFVVENNSSGVLAAAVKNSSPSEKEDLVRYCTFYTVDEVKKKGGKWIGHQSREKHSGFAYNVIGQMKLQNTFISEPRWHIPEYIVQESVLYEIDSKQAALAYEKPKLGRELAAVEVRTVKNAIPNGEMSFSEGGFKDKTSTAVILPGAVHSVPNKGLPSPLIDRWRSGGSCDCGGWDIGCKLRILSNTVQSNNNQFQLFDQEGNQNNVPVFTLVPLKSGIYTVEFRSSISMLQAFFISVTLLSSHNQFDLSDPIRLAESKAFLDLPTGRKKPMKKNAPPDVKETPVKYAPNPPLSPVGRV